MVERLDLAGDLDGLLLTSCALAIERRHDLVGCVLARELDRRVRIGADLNDVDDRAGRIQDLDRAPGLHRPDPDRQEATALEELAKLLGFDLLLELQELVGRLLDGLACEFWFYLEDSPA